jgi:hypothetical protein
VYAKQEEIGGCVDVSVSVLSSNATLEGESAR